MKRTLILGFGLASLAILPAAAADLPVKAPIIAPVPVMSWSNCYVGANGGAKWGRFRDSAATPAGTGTIPGLGAQAFAADTIDLGSLDTTSGVVGGQLGCRWETRDHWVFGLEGDFDWSNLQGTITQRRAGTGFVFVPGDTFANRARWQSSFRGVLGHSWDRVLLYMTGGLALTRVSMDANFIATVTNGVPFPASAGSDAKTLAGFTVGAGGAYAFHNNWEIGAEYRFTAYQGGDFGLGNVAAVCGFTTAIPGQTVGCLNTTATGHKDLSTHEVLLKLNYRFDWGGPVVARY